MTTAPYEYRVRQHGAYLAIRQCAAAIRAAVEAAPPDAPIVLDFTDVLCVTVGFADELVAKLQVQFPGRVRWKGAGADVAETISLAVSRREGGS